MFRLIRWLVILVILAVGFVVADRALVHVAQQKIAIAIQDDGHLANRPTVRVHGFPFVTQAVRGRYTDIEVTATDLFSSVPATSAAAASGVGAGADTGTRAADIGARGSTLTLDLRGVRIPLVEAASGHVASVAITQASGAVTVTFADLERAAKVPGLSLSAGQQANEVAVTESVEVAGVPVKETLNATLTTAGHTITSHAAQLTGSAARLSAQVLAALRAHASFSIVVPGLPPGLRLGQVSVGVSGVELPVEQTDLTLTR